jgi:hypothetical protein
MSIAVLLYFFLSKKASIGSEVSENTGVNGRTSADTGDATNATRYTSIRYPITTKY